MDAVVETDETIMERYLEGEEIGGEELGRALEGAVSRGELFPVACGAATQNLGTTSLLDLIVEGVPSPAEKQAETDGNGPAAFVFKTVADPFAGRITVFRVVSGELSGDLTLVNARTGQKERLGALLTLQGKEHEQASAFPAGDIGAVAKLKDTMTGDVLQMSEQAAGLEPIDFPSP